MKNEDNKSKTIAIIDKVDIESPCVRDSDYSCKSDTNNIMLILIII